MATFDRFTAPDPPVAVMAPPLVLTAALMLVAPLPERSWSAISTRFNLLEVDRIDWLMSMWLCALSVSVASPPPVLPIAALTAMLPVPAPPPVVSTMTSLPSPRAALIKPTGSVELPAPVGVCGDVAEILLGGGEDTMVMSSGSISHVPPRPDRAEGSGRLPTSGMCGPRFR